MTPLSRLLDTYRTASQSEREKGFYFENLVKRYLLTEPSWRDLFGGKVYLWEEWRAQCMKRGQSDPGADAGIDLVAVEDVATSPRVFAIQAKFYAEDAKIRKSDGIDSFLSAMGKQPYTDGLLFLTNYQASQHVVELVQQRDKPVQIISLYDLEASQIDWARYQPGAAPVLKPKKQLRDHQKTALTAVAAGLTDADRGKLIMACGTGKTFTALKIAEALGGAGKRVLFLVPSLNLLSQTLTEWTQEAAIPLHSFAVCSDSDVGKKREDGDDYQTLIHELRYPATTDAARLAHAVAARHDADHMSVVFSTYHSIDVLHRAQHEHGLAAFDLIVCDEAHRTTGATFGDDDESAFVRVHDADHLRAAKRLYMTATPRIYGDTAKAKADQENVALCSMDDESLYGHELYVITFSEAVRRELLVDYKVIVLAVEETHINRRLQTLLADESNSLKVDDAARIVGCWKALSKQGLAEELIGDDKPMQRAVAFCQVIEVQKGGKAHKVSSKQIKNMFQAVVEAYQEQESGSDSDDAPAVNLVCEAEHVDGGMNASEKEARLDWLKAQTPDNTCRILSNVRCLSEGVDVPALDAVLFLTPRNSQVDVVQSVGRVMRNSPGKKRGYVILPVVIPAGVEPHEALNDNKTYAVVWQVLQALRSHDDRFDAFINKLDLIGQDTSKMEVIAITDTIQKKQKAAPKGKRNKNAGRGTHTIGTPDAQTTETPQAELEFEIGEVERALYARLVQKVGNRHHWEDWANDIAKIARTHIDRITGILDNPANTTERKAFDAFAAELRDDLNDSLSGAEIVEMLAQHLITKPVFDALFEGYSFASHNPMSLAMQGVLDALNEHHLEKEADTLTAFYDSVKLRAVGIDNAAGKQKIIVELYDKFFANAFPRLRDKLGIVYTPVEVVDFILHSVAYLLQTEFGQTLGSEGVHILDPFTGTGTFITRLLQSGLIAREQLPHKYKNEILANEIVLLAYYIAAINIEAAYHGLMGGDYQPFEGICLTDTFQLSEKEDLVDALLADNSARRKRQKTLDIRVIVGNPPYSVGQSGAADDNQNVGYPYLDKRISQTYVARSSARTRTNVYDSYIRAIRWASDRIGNCGVIGYVTNASFLDANASDGLRKTLAEEFSSLYVFHLRGNARTSGEQRRKEKDNVFGMGSRAPIAISLLVKNPAVAARGQIHFHDIGDYLSREDKLETIQTYGSVAGIAAADGWQRIEPDAHGDWLRHRDDSFGEFIVLGDKAGGTALFEDHSYGPITHRDAWVYNFSRSILALQMTSMLAFYDKERRRYQAGATGIAPVKFVEMDERKIAWDDKLFRSISSNKLISYSEDAIVKASYRPFTAMYFYFDRSCIWSAYQMPRIFPDAAAENLVIQINAKYNGHGFIALISNALPDLHCNGDSQCFPLYLYETAEEAEVPDAPETPKQDVLFTSSHQQRTRRDAITNAGLAHFCEAYPGETITKEDVFYYVYGLLHSPDYRERYADNLAKELPRIPRVKTAANFRAFSQAGRALADLHLNYETVQPYPLKIEGGGLLLTDADYRVEKMKVGKTGKDKDLTTLIYNDKITLTGIPIEAWEYVVNGKPALDWVVERQSVKTDKTSGIVNDANAWAVETMHNPKYPLELFCRVVTVSLETMKIVRGLPGLTAISSEARLLVELHSA